MGMDNHATSFTYLQNPISCHILVQHWTRYKVWWSLYRSLLSHPKRTIKPFVRKPVLGSYDQVRLKLACSATETSYSPEILD